MFRIRDGLLLIATASLLACSAGGDDTAATRNQQSGSDYPEGSWRARYLALGQETYVTACASCHDEATARPGPTVRRYGLRFCLNTRK